jgi:hypothetical protein
MQCLSYIATLHSAILQHRIPAPAGTSNDSCGVWGSNERNTLYYLVPLFNCNLVDTRLQQYSTDLHTNGTQNTEDRTHITIAKKKKLGSKLGSVGHAPSLRDIP